MFSVRFSHVPVHKVHGHRPDRQNGIKEEAEEEENEAELRSNGE